MDRDFPVSGVTMQEPNISYANGVSRREPLTPEEAVVLIMAGVGNGEYSPEKFREDLGKVYINGVMPPEYADKAREALAYLRKISEKASGPVEVSGLDLDDRVMREFIERQMNFTGDKQYLIR